MNLLQINTSMHGQEATSSQLASAIATRLLDSAASSGQLQMRDLGTQPLPHLTANGFAGFPMDPADRTLEQRQTADLSDTLIEELKSADTIVLGLPMYNFGIPSTLKAWIDHVARAGVTFSYSSEGPKGHLAGKRLVVAATRGGIHAGTEADVQSAYIRQVFGFLGITDVTFIYAEGMASDRRSQAIDAAVQEIDRLAA